MITDQKSFEAALEKIAKFLEHPPHEGTPLDSEFANLLEEVARYQTELHSLPRSSALDGVVARAHDLMHDAAALRKAREKATKPRWSSFPEDGQGVGPTTGV